MLDNGFGFGCGNGTTEGMRIRVRMRVGLWESGDPIRSSDSGEGG